MVKILLYKFLQYHSGFTLKRIAKQISIIQHVIRLSVNKKTSVDMLKLRIVQFY